MNEIDVIKGCFKNDRASQRVLYEAYYGKMLGVCQRYSNSDEEAREILREGFLKAFNNLKSYNNKGSFEDWLRMIIINTAIDHLRRNKQNYMIVSTVYADQKTSYTADQINEDELVSNIDHEEILKAIQELTPAYRTVYNLFVIEGYTHKEISELLDISEGTSQSNLSKAKFNLKKSLMHLIKNSDGK